MPEANGGRVWLAESDERHDVLRRTAVRAVRLMLRDLFLRFLLRLSRFLRGVLVLHGDDLAVHGVDVDLGDAALRRGDVERVDELPMLVLELLALDRPRRLLQGRGARLRHGDLRLGRRGGCERAEGDDARESDCGGEFLDHAAVNAPSTYGIA